MKRLQRRITELEEQNAMLKLEMKYQQSEHLAREEEMLAREEEMRAQQRAHTQRVNGFVSEIKALKTAPRN